MMKGDDIEERLIDFAVRVVKLCAALPKNPAARHIAGQLVRSGTAPAALYAEVRGAESNRDFVHKLRLCLKELNESRVWIKIIIRSEIVPEAKLQDLARESDELCRIINASTKTASQRTQKASKATAVT